MISKQRKFNLLYQAPCPRARAALVSHTVWAMCRYRGDPWPHLHCLGNLTFSSQTLHQLVLPWQFGTISFRRELHSLSNMLPYLSARMYSCPHASTEFLTFDFLAFEYLSATLGASPDEREFNEPPLCHSWTIAQYSSPYRALANAKSISSQDDLFLPPLISFGWSSQKDTG